MQVRHHLRNFSYFDYLSALQMLILAAAELQIRQNEGRVFLNKKTRNPCQNYFPETIFLMSLSLLSASRGVRLLTSRPKISSRT